MNNTDNSANDEEKLAIIPMDYSALLAMTRPLIITEYTLLSLRGDEVFRSGSGISPEPAESRVEFDPRRGEILCPEGESNVARDSIFALGETVSNLKLKIYLGMS